MDVREYDKVSRYILHIEFKLGRGGARNSPTQALNPQQGGGLKQASGVLFLPENFDNLKVSPSFSAANNRNN